MGRVGLQRPITTVGGAFRFTWLADSTLQFLEYSPG